MNKALEKNIKTLESLFEISDLISSSSSLMSKEEKDQRKEAVLKDKESLIRLKTDLKDHLNSISIKGMIEGFLIFWNEWISLDSERFWDEVKQRGLEIKRKRSLRTILDRGRFLDVHEAMSARTQWTDLIASNFVANQFRETERQKLLEIMDMDELKRVNLFKKCLKNQNLTVSSAFMYTDSMAYFSLHNLYEKHFSLLEINQIQRICEEFQVRWLNENMKTK
jgi:hypothetical protein